MSIDRLYQTEVMDHYRHPRNKGMLDYPDLVTELSNPACGDAVVFDLQIRDGVVVAIRFQGAGCVLSQATASMVSELVLHKRLDEIRDLDMHCVTDRLGMTIGPTRMRCVLLSLDALKRVC